MNETLTRWRDKRPHLEKLFWERTALIPFHPCWEWIGYRVPKGYGSLRTSDNIYRAHQLSFWLFKDPTVVWRGRACAHICDNPGCVNPDHLRNWTYKENSHDARAKGRLFGQTKESQDILNRVRAASRVSFSKNNAGLKCKMSKFKSEDQIRNVRKMRANGFSLTEIAEKYGVTITSISKICLRQTFKDIK